MRNAKLYLVGIKHLCFSEWIFFKWILYALGQAGIIYFAAMIVIGSPNVVS